jgi:hypothetical protein
MLVAPLQKTVSVLRACSLDDGMSIMELGRQFETWEKGETVKTENRKFERYVVEHLAFAVFRPGFKKLGKIKDISWGGLAFEYITSEGRMEDSLEIDIFISGARFHMSRVPTKPIYDTKVVTREPTFAPFLEKRRCGVRFGKLTAEQVAQLAHFLETHTTGLAP